MKRLAYPVPWPRASAPVYVHPRGQKSCAHMQGNSLSPHRSQDVAPPQRSRQAATHTNSDIGDPTGMPQQATASSVVSLELGRETN